MADLCNDAGDSDFAAMLDKLFQDREPARTDPTDIEVTAEESNLPEVTFEKSGNPNEDKLREMVAQINVHSHHHSEVEEPAPDDPLQIRWAWVGHNASHQFDLGVDSDDRIWERASGEEFDQKGFDTAGGLEAAEARRINNDDFIVYKTSEPSLVGDWTNVRHQYIGHW